MREVKAEKDGDDAKEGTAPRPPRSSRAAVKEEEEEEEEEPVVTKSGRKVVRPQSPPSVNKPAAERSPGKHKVHWKLEWQEESFSCCDYSQIRLIVHRIMVQFG